jgi:hypothetical protein
MKENTKERKINKAAVAGVAGAAIGVGVAVAASKILSDEKTKKKITKALTDTKSTILKSVKDLKGKTEKMMQRNEKKVEEVKTKATKALPKSKTKSRQKAATTPEPARA